MARIDAPLARAVRVLLTKRRSIDSTDSVPVYDLHDANGAHTGYVLVRANWLDAIWLHAHAMDPGVTPPMPHSHLDPLDG